MHVARQTLVQYATVAFLLPCVLIALNGTGIAWCIYEWEWEDILTHYYQSSDPTNPNNKHLGRTFITRILENNKHGSDPTLPKPAAITPDIRAIQVLLPTEPAPPMSHCRYILFRSKGSVSLGCTREVFHPPTSRIPTTYLQKV
ncbi:MAG: hypothetical protein RML40_11885 [Bacteroidota bacterium]|nr:hypothetical protein [Candidatus Kapabacteria bacterium]MDW8221215.1 hypothetical protein [Bacteroidota bacterium]